MRITSEFKSFRLGVSWLLVVTCFLGALGCDRARNLNHPISTAVFEGQVQFEWSHGDSFGGDESSAWWQLKISDSELADHTVRYSLYLHDGNDARFLRGVRDPVALPFETNKMSHEGLGQRALEGGWRLRLDYELYSSGDDLLLKGSMYSQPSPAMNNLTKKQNKSEMATPRKPSD
jgi:hypothetical protein